MEKGGRDELDIFKEYFVELRERDESDERKENDENWSMAIAKNDIKISKVPNKSNTFHFKSQIVFKPPKESLSYEFRAVICAKCPLFYRIFSNIQTYEKPIKKEKKKEVSKIPLILHKENGHFGNHPPNNLLKNDYSRYLSKLGTVKNDWIIWKIKGKGYASLDKLNIRNWQSDYALKKASLDISEDGENWEGYSQELLLENKEGMQSIAIIKKKENRKGKPFSFIRTNFIENYGSPSYICFYELELFGREA